MRTAPIVFTSRRKVISMSLDNQQIRLSQILSRLCTFVRKYEVATSVVRGPCMYYIRVYTPCKCKCVLENYLLAGQV